MGNAVVPDGPPPRSSEQVGRRDAGRDEDDHESRRGPSSPRYSGGIVESTRAPDPRAGARAARGDRPPASRPRAVSRAPPPPPSASAIELRTELATLQTRERAAPQEQAEAGETAAKLLGEMKELVNQVAHKFQGPSKYEPLRPRAAIAPALSTAR